MEAYNWNVNFQLKEPATISVFLSLVYLLKLSSLSRKRNEFRSNDLQMKLHNPLISRQ